MTIDSLENSVFLTSTQVQVDGTTENLISIYSKQEAMLGVTKQSVNCFLLARKRKGYTYINRLALKRERTTSKLAIFHGLIFSSV